MGPDLERCTPIVWQAAQTLIGRSHVPNLQSGRSAFGILDALRIIVGMLVLPLLFAVNAAAQSIALANTGEQNPSPATRQLVNWVVTTRDSQTLPFLVVDKVRASIFAFRADGVVLGSAPVLIGLTPGDTSVPGIGERKLSAIGPLDRTTPAGRFRAALGVNLHGKTILWVDYDLALSVHPIVAGTPSERRAARMASNLPSERRITYGCINVAANFFSNIIVPAARTAGAIVYILPETKSAASLFGYRQDDEVALLKH